MHRKQNKVKSALAALESAIESGDAAECTAALGECCTAAAAYAEAKANPPKPRAGAKAATAPDPAELIECLDRIEQKCATAKAATTPAPEGGAQPKVAALWDGSLFIRLLDALPGLIAIFRDLFGSTQPA